ncbi:hypothetical protein BD410DRAFT_780489 [Rickenella mellea]|uniref:Uncharacterized protein n=1 Tax=Rickenella mellea TaxID=50990 RepID=A0A4R5XGQ4_9AGAM|nr:hypothetical protein BD410DRAFT_780489 [Rickenella mellea]
MSRLPDEILKEILTPPLQIPDDEFSFTGRASESPFGRTARNSSSLLVVSKQWMRVATPLLYEVVIIRSTAQAEALACAVKYNKAFGLFIRRLRMEGGFGKSPARFIASAPNIRELFVTLDVWSDDNASGLCNVLSGMNIRRLIMNQQDYHIKNAKASRLWGRLSTCIPQWLNLEVLEYHTSYIMAMLGEGKYMELVTLLEASPSVKHIVLDCVPEDVLEKLASITSLDSISVKSVDSEEGNFISSNPRLFKLVSIRSIVPGEPTSGVLPFASVTVAGFTPLQNVPQHTATHIWDLIFSFATHSYYVENPPMVKPLTARNSKPSRAIFYSTAQCLSLVSKSFCEIVRRHLFSIVQVENGQRFTAFSNAINDNNTIAHLVRVLRVEFRRSLGADLDFDNVMTQLLPKLTALVFLEVPQANLNQLESLNAAAATNLQTLDVRLTARSQRNYDTVNLGVLGGLTYLRCRFDKWEMFYRNTLTPQTLIVDLPNLTSFSMGLNEKEHPLDAFYLVRMPSLTHLQLSGGNAKTEEFLRLNGDTVKVLDICQKPSSALWTWCLHLEHLTVRKIDPTTLFKSLPEGQTHPCLKKLYFKPGVPGSPVEKIMLSAMEGFELVNFSQFPNFREMHIYGLTWPNTERNMKKNPTCNSFGLCMKKWGIVVYDESGTPWRERAQVRRR